MHRASIFLRELKNSIMAFQDEDDDYIQEIKKAKEEWLAAQNYFENVVDHDLVDYAIYKLEAARRKYMYMLRQAEIKGITNGESITDING